MRRRDAEKECLMCGLAGIFHPRGAGAIDAALLARMTTALAHRGPDGDGFHVEPQIGLGHRRLAIIDIAGGAQPMFNEDGSVVIVFNGEIYNFAQLRPRLEALGHVFRSHHSDTETIIHAWESFGPDCLRQLNGQFAFALWDRRRGLFLARDRLGKKPLYYATDSAGRLVFGSELAALACVPTLPRRIDPAAVDDFLALGYVPEPDSIYAGIRRLPAAHFLLIEREGVVPAPRRYWDVPIGHQPCDEATARTDLLRRLTASTASRMVADVPLGAFLSGGVDSSAVVAIAAGLRATPLDTFTIGFEGAEDETPYAAQVATRYRTTQHNARAAAVDMIDAARQQGRIFGEPFGDPSAVPTHSVCALARRHATVALSGDGGDEVFAGYRRYRWHVLVDGVRRLLPAGLRRHAIGTLARLYPKLDRAPRWLRAKHTLGELSLDSALGYASTVTRIQAASRRALYAPAFAAALAGHDPTERFVGLMDARDSDDALAQAQYVDLHSWLPGDILTKVDRASMANSLEVRSPLLDFELVSWGLALPPALKLKGTTGKYLLKRALEPHLPAALLYRPKQGFASSPAALFRAQAGRLRARLLGETMADAGLFALPALARLIDQHAAGVFDHSAALWLLLVFEGFLAAAAAPVALAEPSLMAS
jgi:asparagine synthase (glutamine-hydrolysing)